ncbi:helicase-exonuclease AddAB subunit AddB [Oceanobacillus alkalisoli]|uniref:helicase-exonuclease AddAB subunit AddB n=1 Tax=Oceanobacillus alkalisoli TaxID=2925113 RepID=UPI001F120DCB|nr:helicase-exonuclease AddAB subunit AddB [Oceanobacillus alkalisoli]MCF3942050.1 helicase-exonuclease AddAB subunit AddB [Oceanobacillus alkalisoli]
MGIRFITGRSGTDKSQIVIQEIKEKLLESPHGKPIFYLVPDQMTFQQERALFTAEGIDGSIRAQVASFSRLAWRILQEVGGGTRQFISSIGIQMMLRKIIEEKEGEWHTFKKALEKQGFLQELERMITEFKRYQVTPEILQQEIAGIEKYVHKEPNEVSLEMKLRDLLYIYEHLMERLAPHYIDSEDQLQLLAEKVGASRLLEDAEIYLDGFHQFTPNELTVVEALLKKCKTVTVVLTLDDTKEEPAELDLFYQTKETYHQLVQLAEANDIPFEEQLEFYPENGRFKERPYFLHMEKYFDTRPAPAYEGEVPIQIAEAVHPRAEVEGAAQEILRLVREKDYRFRDFAIFMREANVYHDLIDTIFADHGIPVFLDEKKSMLNHPFIEFIRSIFDVIEGNWRYDAVFRVLKTGFVPPADKRYPLTADAIDELENYVLEYGIRTRERWFAEEEWVFQRFRGFDEAGQTDKELEKQKRINRYRRQIVYSLQVFDEAIREAETVRKKCEVLFELFEQVRAPERLEEMREMDDAAGEIEKAREQEQVWDGVLQILDELVEMAGDETLSLDVFRSTLEAGLETLEFAHVPPSMDHVIVGTIDRSRIGRVQVAFLLGVNDGVWPMKPAGEGLINERERELLEQNGVRLAESSVRQLLDDQFFMYLAFTVAKDRLHISYTLSDEEGKGKMPSQLITRMEDLFPATKERFLLQDPDDLARAERFITNPVKTRAALTAQLARYRRGYPVEAVWWHVLNWYMEHEPKYETTYMILQSLYYQNLPTDLAEDTIKELYPKQVKASVSRLETYYRCSYQHFARYSLNLEERKRYKLDAPNIGQLFHEALKVITEWIRLEGRDYKELTKEDSSSYANRAVGKLAPILQHQILYSSNRYKYIQQKLQETIARATFILSEQARKSNFSPVGLEVAFGEGAPLKPMVMQLPNGYELILRGRIDRVDQAKVDDGFYLRIIDYKSSDHGLNLVDVYYGLALQMLAYLDVVLSQSEEWLGMKATPAGVLYFHVHNPMISNQPDMEASKLEKELFKQFKMKGLLLQDESTVRSMDTALETGHSDMLPVALTKTGNFYKASKVATEDTFNDLQHYIHGLIEQAGIEITTGKVKLNPYQDQQMIACRFCPFLSVCQFDTGLEENEFRKLKQMSENEVLEKIAGEEEH